MADTTYATTDDLREILDILESDGKPNALLQRYLNAAAQVIDAQTRGESLEGYEQFSVSASETRYFDDIISNNGVIDIDDAVTVTALTRGGVAIASTDYYTYPYNRGTGPITQLRLLSSALVSNPVYQMLGRSYNFPYKGVGIKAMAVTGTWGYCTAGNRPPEIREATLLQAASMYRKTYMPADVVAQAIRDPFKYLTDDVQMLIGRFVKSNVGLFS